MIDGSRNERMMNVDYTNAQEAYVNGYEDPEDDDGLENYLAVEDADMMTVNRSYGLGGDEYHYGKEIIARWKGTIK